MLLTFILPKVCAYVFYFRSLPTRPNPKNFEATLLLGELYFSNMDDKAFECFDLLKKLRPSSAKGYFYKGKVILYRGNNYEKAIADFNKVLDFSAENKSAYKGLAIAFANLKNKKLALENFDKFVELSGEKNFYDLLGEIYFALGDYEKAVENFSKHLEIKSYAVESYYLRGRSYFEQKNFAKALADFEEYVSTWYEIMSEDCYLSESETNYAEAKKFRDLCKKIWRDKIGQKNCKINVVRLCDG